MNQINKPVSKFRIAFMWILTIGFIIGITTFFVWQNQGRTTETETSPAFFYSVVMLVLGAFGLMAGVAAYIITIATNCFTFDFRQPVWQGLRAKIFLANTFVPLILALGLGFMLSAFLSPALSSMGLSGSLANILPVMGMIVLVQILQLWVLFWAPLEKRAITRRLLALGITQEQLRTGIFIGLSNPAAGALKRMGTIEEDMGALWIGPDQLVYWGDGESFALKRDQLVLMERKADTRSTTMLGGVAHVILHLQLPGGAQRQIRLHTEGLWTMGQKRKAMDDLANRIATWHSVPVAKALD